MSKKIIRLFLTVTCILTLTACADSTGTGGSTDRPAPGESPSVTEPAAPKASPEPFQSPSENADIIIEKSLLGYSMTYDSALFTLDATNGNDSYIYHTEEALDAPVYIFVQAYPDMDAPVLAEGIALQSGIDGVTPQDAYFGRDGIETKNIYMEQEVNGKTQTQTFYVIPVSQGSLLVEIGGYTGMPEKAEAAFEEMLGSFALETK